MISFVIELQNDSTEKLSVVTVYVLSQRKFGQVT